MQKLTAANISDFLGRFENIDGGFIDSIGVDLEKKTVEFCFTAFDTHRGPVSMGESAWVTLRIRVTEYVEFCLHEGARESGVQLDDHLEVVWFDDAVFLVLDPLQARDYDQPGWTIEQVRRSRWYVGGQSLFWSLTE